jgi:alcohol dehydrogenase, propanol-preferring
MLVLAAAAKVKHTITTLRLDDINDRVDALGRGDVVGRQVVVFD